MTDLVLSPYRVCMYINPKDAAAYYIRDERRCFWAMWRNSQLMHSFFFVFNRITESGASASARLIRDPTIMELTQSLRLR